MSVAPGLGTKSGSLVGTSNERGRSEYSSSDSQGIEDFRPSHHGVVVEDMDGRRSGRRDQDHGAAGARVKAVALHDDGDVVFLQVFDVGLDVDLRFVIGELAAQRGSGLRRLANARVGVRHPAGGNRGAVPTTRRRARRWWGRAPRAAGPGARPPGSTCSRPHKRRLPAGTVVCSAGAALVVPNIGVDKHINPVRTLRVQQIEDVARRHPIGVLITERNELPELGVVAGQRAEVRRPIGRIAGVGRDAVVERHLDVVVRVDDQ